MLANSHVFILPILLLSLTAFGNTNQLWHARMRRQADDGTTAMPMPGGDSNFGVGQPGTGMVGESQQSLMFVNNGCVYNVKLVI